MTRLLGLGRPGTQGLLLAQIDQALDGLEVRRKPPPIRSRAQSAVPSINHDKALGQTRSIDAFLPQIRSFWSRWQWTQQTVVQEAQWAAVGLAVGLTCYLCLMAIFAIFTWNGVIFDLTRFIAFFLAAILGYSYSRTRFLTTFAPLMGGEADPCSLQVAGWKQVKNQLTLWFSLYLRKPPSRPYEQIDALICKLGIETNEQQDP